MSHIVDSCPLTKFYGGLQLLHEAEDDAVKWLESTANYSILKINIANGEWPPVHLTSIHWIQVWLQYWSLITSCN